MRIDKQIRVLVAEDDYIVAQSVVRALRGLGCNVIGEAADGEEAVALTESLNPDLVMMDIEMPRMDGLEATRRIQETYPTPVVALTAYESPDFLKRASEAGVSAYLVKPSDKLEMERAITIALARHSDLMELRRANAELEKALAEVKRLSGLLPICSSCKKIRDDQGYWQQVDVYVREHSEANFSHGICPECARKLYPDLMD
jgi:two-component system, response regulator PdtaR